MFTTIYIIYYTVHKISINLVHSASEYKETKKNYQIIHIKILQVTMVWDTSTY